MESNPGRYRIKHNDRRKNQTGQRTSERRTILPDLWGRVADINIAELLKFHQEGGRMATLTSVQPMGRFGALDLREDGEITNFKEKKQEDSGWINAGFMVLEPEILDLIEGDATVFEKYPLEEAARRGQLDAYRHNGFWQCMDTMNEKKKLEEMWRSGNAPWKVWE